MVAAVCFWSLSHVFNTTVYNCIALRNDVVNSIQIYLYIIIQKVFMKPTFKCIISVLAAQNGTAV